MLLMQMAVVHQWVAISLLGSGQLKHDCGGQLSHRRVLLGEGWARRCAHGGMCGQGTLLFLFASSFLLLVSFSLPLRVCLLAIVTASLPYGDCLSPCPAVAPSWLFSKFLCHLVSGMLACVSVCAVSNKTVTMTVSLLSFLPSLVVVPISVGPDLAGGGGFLGLAALLLVVSNIISWGPVVIMVGSFKSLCVSKSFFATFFVESLSLAVVPISGWCFAWLGVDFLDQQLCWWWLATSSLGV